MSSATSGAAINEVRLAGRVSAVLDERTLPSGDAVRPVRVVVPRPQGVRRGGSPVIDVIDVACWTAPTRAVAATLAPGDPVEVTGSLHRRFFRTGPAVQSRYEVRAEQLRRVPADSSSPP